MPAERHLLVPPDHAQLVDSLPTRRVVAEGAPWPRPPGGL